MDELQKAIEAWAKDCAASYEKHGRPDGQEPKEWCNDALMDDVLENAGVVDALQAVIEKAFMKAVG